MSMPPRNELDRMRKKLENVEPTRGLPANATKISQKELAEKLGIEPARLNEIVKYRIDLFTVDRLLGYVEMLNPEIKVTVA